MFLVSLIFLYRKTFLFGIKNNRFFFDEGGLRGVGGGGRPSSSGIRPLADPKGPSFGTFYEINFWPTDPKIFLKALGLQYILILKGNAREKKNIFFLSKFSKKFPKTAFSTCFRPEETASF